MKTPSTSKKSKPISDEDITRKKKKKKTKSSKRRRRDYSSSSSDSEDEPRSRRKDPKLKKRRKDNNKSDKKKSRRKKKHYSRHRSISSSCSTCSVSSDRSRSPVRKALKSRSRSPVRRSDRREKSRGRSKGRKRERRGRSRSEDRESKRIKPVVAATELVDEEERFGDGDKIIQAYDDFPPNFNNIKDSVKDSDKSCDESVGKESESVKDGKKEAEDLESILRQKALENFKKFRGGLSAQKANQEDEIVKPSETSELNNSSKEYDARPYDKQSVGRGTDSEQPKRLASSIVASFTDGQMKMNQVKRVGVVGSSTDGETTWNQVRRVPVLDSPTGVQKTLNPFKWVRESSNNMSVEQHRGRGSSIPPGGRVNVPDARDSQTHRVVQEKRMPIISSSTDGPKTVNQLKVVREPSNKMATEQSKEHRSSMAPVHRVNISDVSDFQTRGVNKEEKVPILGSSTDAPKADNQLKRVREPSNKMSVEQTSLANETHNKDRGSSMAPGGHMSVAKVPDSQDDDINKENDNSKPNEPIVESESGSQFAQKTFSRMHDGEMVQVSYKVYIPKRAPALARRPLQR